MARGVSGAHQSINDAVAGGDRITVPSIWQNGSKPMKTAAEAAARIAK